MTVDRYTRQIALDFMGENGQKKLLQSRVLLVGAGGLGSAAALYLAGAGVGHIGICDGDNVEKINLHRQVIHAEENAGKNKALSAREGILRLNSELEVNVYPFRLTAENAMDLISKYDFVLDCTDTFSSKFLINDACVLAKKPFCHAGVVRTFGQATTYVPNANSPCLRCFLEDAPRLGSYERAVDVGVLGPAVGILGCVQATEAIKYLVGARELLTGKIFQINALDLTAKTLQIPSRNPDCPVCAREGFKLNEHLEDYI